MSASEAQRAGPAAASISRRIWRHASRRWARWRTGSVARSSAATASRTVSWTTSPSRPSSTKGSAARRAKASCGGTSRNSAASSESVTRRSTQVAVERRRASAGRGRRGRAAASSCDHGRQDRVLGRVGALAHGRRRELQRQRVAVDEAVDPRGLLVVEARAAQHLGGVARAPAGRRGTDAQQLAERRAPRGARRVARRHDDARVPGQRGQQLQAQPPVDEPQALGGVDRHHHGARQRRERGGETLERCVDAAGEGGEEARGRGLDLAAVDGDERRAALDGLDAEGPQRASTCPSPPCRGRRRRAARRRTSSESRPASSPSRPTSAPRRSVRTAPNVRAMAVRRWRRARGRARRRWSRPRA